MDVKRPLLAIVMAGSLVACGGANTDLERGETNCDESGQEATNEHDEECVEEGPDD